MTEPNLDRNPRTHKVLLQPFVGKKVNIGLTNFHYVCGVFEGFEEDRLRVRVAGETMRIERVEVATIQEAPAYQAEYVK